jgi:hypothetical protein
MPVSPEFAMGLAKEILAIYSTAEETLLGKIAARLARGIDEPNWADLKLLEVQQLRVEVEQVIAALIEGSNEAVDQALRIGYNRGIAGAGADMTSAGASPAMAFGRIDEHAIEALVQAAQDRLAATHLRIRRSAVDMFTDVIHQSAGQVLTGVETRREAAARALDKYAQAGIKGFVDKAGRGWDLATYAEMSTRTAAAQAAVQGHTDKLIENGIQLVIVSNAPEECKICRPWEGKVLALTADGLGKHRGKNYHGSGDVSITVTKTLADAVDDGLFHPNCRHNVGMFRPGLTMPMVHTEDPKGDELRQRQRALERGVREAKKKEIVQKAWYQEYVQRHGRIKAGDPYGAKVKARYDKAVAKRRDAQDALASFIDDNDRKNLSYRTSLKAR